MGSTNSPGGPGEFYALGVGNVVILAQGVLDAPAGGTIGSISAFREAT
jgi:hypothetical protein